MLKEFKEFAMKGSVLDLAIGVIIGAAFGKIVTSMVEDLLMPVVGLVLGKIDFANLFISLNGTASDTGGRQEGGGANAELWLVPEQRDQLPDRGVRHLPGREADQPVQARARPRRRWACHQGVSVLPHDHSRDGDALPELHLRDADEGGGNSRVAFRRPCGNPARLFHTTWEAGGNALTWSEFRTGGSEPACRRPFPWSGCSRAGGAAG